MPVTRKCRGCGADIPTNAPFGHCPNCLLELGFGPLPEGLAGLASSDTSSRRNFGDYELLEQIGRGGMGVIYRARQITLNRLVALKMVSAGEFASPTMIQRFHLEAEAAANLHHPNIVPIYETGAHQGQHFFSMELVDGSGLNRYITSAGFYAGEKAGADKATLRARQEQIARIMAKLARAVDYAHQHGVLHRDLKPSNVLLDSRGEPRLTDFGVAKVIGRSEPGLTASGAIMGSLSYMAPEQAAGQSRRVTTAADIYSLGAILYEMLTGDPPFRADTPVGTLKQVVEQEPKHPTAFKDGVDRDLATICMKCLEKEPQRRYSTAAALAEDLERWLRREPILARPAGTGERFWRWCRRNPKLAALGASVAFLLVVLSLVSSAFALHIKEQRDSARKASVALQKQRDIERNRSLALQQQVLDNLDKLFADKSTESFIVSSETRRALSDQPPVVNPAVEFIFVEHNYEHPTNMLDSLSPIMDTLETAMSRRLGRPVVIQMHLLKTPSATYRAMESTNVVFGRMGPASYVYLNDRRNGARLLAMQDHTKPLTMAIFTRTNSAVARLASSLPGARLSVLLSNRSLALTHSNSTTGNYLAKWFLASEGIYRTNLSGYTYQGSQRAVRDAVLAGRADVGAGNLDLFDNSSDFQVLARFPVDNLGRCWVAGIGLDAAMEKHFQSCLLELKDPATLARIESEVSGFKLLDQAAINQLREYMRGAAAFDEPPEELPKPNP